MIETIITHTCPRCGSVNLVKNGRDYKGAQKFRCNDCQRYGTLKEEVSHRQRVRTAVERAFTERVSLRGLARVFGVSRTTITRWLTQTLAQIPAWTETIKEGRVDDVLELDEVWSFVGSKARQRWVWVALCRRTRQVVAYWMGDRSEASAVRLWERLPDAYRRCRSFSDKWNAYRYVFDYKRHRQVNKEEGETNHIERWFNTLRQRLSRFTRKTLSFSKRDDRHEDLLRLFLARYNLACIS